MKKNGASHALLTPGATGWRIRVTGAQDNTATTLDEALAAIPANAHIELSLPCQSVLLERHKLPATDRAEIADMLQLQLEKTLPFPVEEMSHGFELLGQDENESTILSIAAHHTQLDQICAPLRDKGRLPERITLEAQRVAAACPVNETALALWPEQDQLTVAIVAGGKLAWAQPLSGRDAETVLG
jgi:Tfp pilus assembly PilM family ATPase